MTAAPTPKPKRPYLLRALFDWMVDNGLTPHLVVAADGPGVEVPRQFVNDGRIILNISPAATAGLAMGNDELSFNARFGGTPQRVRVPIASILGIYARESGEGLVFPPDEYPGAGAAPDTEDTPPRQPDPPGRPRLKIIK